MAVLGTVILLRVIFFFCFVLMSLFCLAVNSEASLSASKA